MAAAGQKQSETATLGGGCFWCTEAVFERFEGVKAVVSGYAGGKVPNPTYKQICTGRTGHAEAVNLIFDPHVVKYTELLGVFWERHDATTLNQQGADLGTQYRSGIYYSDEQQAAVAREIMAEMAASGVYSRPLVTEVLPLNNYWPAEAYHQDFFERNPHQGYCMAVAAPKVEKFRKTFSRLQKT